MVKTTRLQRVALKRTYDRCPPRPYITPDEIARGVVAAPLTYKQFRRGVQPTFGCDGAVVLPWAGMFVCIEQDGYAHT